MILSNLFSMLARHWHSLLPLGQAGIKTTDNEQTVVASFRDNVEAIWPLFSFQSLLRPEQHKLAVRLES
jgi:hypothetical protein